MSISIILPSYQEYKNLEIILPTLEYELGSFISNYEVLVVDTMMSMDETPILCSKYRSVKYINRENGNTYGDAIRTGIKYASYEYIVIMDSDGSHPINKIKELYDNIINNNFDIIICSRYIKGGNSHNIFILKFMSFLVNIVYRIVFSLNVKDVSNSFRIYKSKMIKSINLECNNFDIVEEILIKLTSKYKCIKIKEIPIFFNKRMYGKSKRKLIRFIFSYIKSIIHLYKIKDNF
ncbi:hypothetical protein SU46_01090 [Brachyspira hyodysenteriae]|uniref:glycosyltransferase n=1 Tax=Brachyspira hyodysenteriae TaxID=159 RepID=UPI00063DB47F|nr:glycosyltransferase [Brachyspira hyodysenteriae]KLI21938.1 hypothetical protein SU46_01090 [Brachyspira hyodysenteriae]